MTILAEIDQFASQYKRKITVNGINWQYYCLGKGDPIFWLGGGLRRAAIGFDFLKRLAEKYFVITLDYSPVENIEAYVSVIDSIIETEGVSQFSIGCQSYGGLIAQAYLASKGNKVKKLVLSSTGPVENNRLWIPLLTACVKIFKIMPEKVAKNFFFGGLGKIITVPKGTKTAWVEALKNIITNELSKQDVVSHFAVGLDTIRNNKIKPDVFKGWTGTAVVLRSDNDPTQGKKDILLYSKLFCRPLKVISMGDMGHTALLSNPAKFTDFFEQALAH